MKSQSSTEESKVNLMVLPAIDHALIRKDKFADRAGLLSLKHLNTLLLKYIGIVHNLDESKIGEENEKWTEEKTKADAEIKRLQNDLKTKEANLANLESEVDDKRRKELEAAIKKLRDEVVELQKKVNPMLHQEHIFKAHITKLQFQ